MASIIEPEPESGCNWPGKVQLVLTDLELEEADVGEFPSIVDQLCAVHAKAAEETNAEARGDATREVQRVLAVLEVLPENTLVAAITGITHWMAAWDQELIQRSTGRTVWMRIWPVAVTVTNAEVPSSVAAMGHVTESDADRAREALEQEALSTPVGKLVSTFLAACARVGHLPKPFETESDLRRMRDTMAGVNGRSEVIVRYKLLQQLTWFLQADQAWTEEYLVRPLREFGAVACELWPAIERQVGSAAVLAVIGDPVVRQATNPDLPRGH